VIAWNKIILIRNWFLCLLVQYPRLTKIIFPVSVANDINCVVVPENLTKQIVINTEWSLCEFYRKNNYFFPYNRICRNVWSKLLGLSLSPNEIITYLTHLFFINTPSLSVSFNIDSILMQKHSFAIVCKLFTNKIKQNNNNTFISKPMETLNYDINWM
jgi:hypothetical protein